MLAFCEQLSVFAHESSSDKKQTIEDYKTPHFNSRTCFDEFLEKLKIADWTIPEDIQSTFPSADLLGKGSNRVVFNIGGNRYRMICWYVFKKEVHLFIKWIGTHAEYDELCGYGKRKKKRSQETDQYTIIFISMAALKYPVIKSREQYNRYCNALEELLSKPKQNKEEEEEIELLTTLIEVWDCKGPRNSAVWK